MPDDPMGLVSVASFRTEWQAEALAAALTTRGVRAVCHGGVLGGWRAETPAMVLVMVARQDAARSRELMNEIRADSVDIDWDEYDVGPEPDFAAAADERSAGSERARTARLLLLLTILTATIVVLWLTRR